MLVLHGEIQALMDEEIVFMQEDDLLLISPGRTHELRSSSDAVLISLLLDVGELAPSAPLFVCDSSRDENKSRYYALKHLLALLVKSNSGEDSSQEYMTRSLLFSILHELQQSFVADERIPKGKNDRQRERLNRILAFIHEHYMDGITLGGLADREHLSAPYLSAFFEKHMGITFSNYYNEIRLRHAVDALISTEDSVESVAYSNGFSDPRSFVTLFKRKYGLLPSRYRKQRRDALLPKSNHILYAKDAEREGFLHILAKYLPVVSDDRGAADGAHQHGRTAFVDKIDISRQEVQLRHTFKAFTSVGRAKELLLTEVQDMLRSLQADVGFEYIKFHGLLSDDMHVYRENENGKPSYSFVLIDKVIDFLISIGLKPLVQFSFMPQHLASDKNRIVYSAPYNVSPPKDHIKWLDLIDALMRHLIERYSMRQVRTWLFCVWNEPDTSTTLFGFEHDEEFYKLYQLTYEKVKSFGKRFRFGSPSMLVSCNENKDWLMGFLSFTKRQRCEPDFLNIHYYDNDFTWDSLPDHRPAAPGHSRLNRDENAFRKTVAQIPMILKDAELDIPVYLTEWNLTVSHRNLLNDTCFKSCYLCKNLLENYDTLDSFGYWTLTDLIEETQISPDEFHGGLGLFTYNGIRKPHYYTIRYISQLGDQLVAKGDGYFVTRAYSGLKIMLYNYQHFNHLFASGEKYDMTFTERYTPFAELGEMDISLELVGIPSENCTVREHVINQKSGSAFDEWVRMGAITPNGDDIEYLKAISRPRLAARKADIIDGCLSISSSLAPLEVRFIEVSF